jgi:CRP-like cAMP-binding protein
MRRRGVTLTDNAHSWSGGGQRGSYSEGGEALTVSGKLRTYGKGEIIFRKGDPATDLYRILSGQVRIFGTQRDRDVTVSVLQEGEFFGEMALSGPHARVVSAQATAETTLSVVDPAELRELVAEPLIWQVIERMGNRINSVEQQFEKLRAKDEIRLENLDKLLQWRAKKGSGLRPF